MLILTYVFKQYVKLHQHRRGKINKLLYFQRAKFGCFLLHYPRKHQQLNWSHMGTKMKGIYKGFKYTLSQMFVVKEREIEIGYPINVKHVSHIGWDCPYGSAPSWGSLMNEFKSIPDFTATSIGDTGSALSPWSSQGNEKGTTHVLHKPKRPKLYTVMINLPELRKDFGESTGQQSGSDMYQKYISPSKLPPINKKQKRKKIKSSLSGSAATTRSKPKFVEGNANTTNIEVA